MDWTYLTWDVLCVLVIVLAAEAANGWSDAPVGTSSAVASGALTSRQALLVTCIGNFVGLLAALVVGAAVAKTIGTGIVRPDIITIPSIGVAMSATIVWSLVALWLGFPISKTHSLLAALAGVGWALGGFQALMPESGNWSESGWLSVLKGMTVALLLGSSLAWFMASFILRLNWHNKISLTWWRRAQFGTVCIVSTGHGFNDGLKYAGIFTLVLLKANIITTFRVDPIVIILCAVVMAGGTLLGGYRIHKRLDTMVNGQSKTFQPFMGVSAELVSGISIWQTGWLGIPMSTNHAVVSAMAGAKSADGKVHNGAIWRIVWGWAVTYVFCFSAADFLTNVLLK